MPTKRAITFALFLFLAKGVAAFAQAAPQSAVDSSVMQPFEAHATEIQGDVLRTRDNAPWVVVEGEHVPVGQMITTGRDGYARFTVAGGSEFSLLSNSRVVFRGNTARLGDLLDVVAGRVRIKLQPEPGQQQQRVFTAIATISASHPALISVAIDEDQNVRVDVLEGEIHVQHRLLPRNEPTLVRAVDAILIERNEQISRRVDRGTLYRYTVKPLHDLWTAVTPAKAHSAEPIEGNKFLQASIRTDF
jgi:ferric-dicitrate binding protein FerR (iron transport regulator)